MALQGYIYRGRKPVHWSPSSRTALAEAELEVLGFLFSLIFIILGVCKLLAFKLKINYLCFLVSNLFPVSRGACFKEHICHFQISL